MQRNIIFLLFITLSLASCFEMKETIHFNADGSGHGSFQIHFIPNDKMKDEKETLAVIGSQYASVRGITDLSFYYKTESNKLWLVLDFNFSCLDSLNRAYQQIYSGIYHKSRPNYIEYTDTTIMRTVEGPYMKWDVWGPINGKGSLRGNAEIISDTGFYKSFAMDKIKYGFEYSFDRKVISVSNENSIIKDYRSVVRWNADWIDIIWFRKSIENKILFQ